MVLKAKTKAGELRIENNKIVLSNTGLRGSAAKIYKKIIEKTSSAKIDNIININDITKIQYLPGIPLLVRPALRICYHDKSRYIIFQSVQHGGRKDYNKVKEYLEKNSKAQFNFDIFASIAGFGLIGLLIALFVFRDNANAMLISLLLFIVLYVVSRKRMKSSK